MTPIPTPPALCPPLRLPIGVTAVLAALVLGVLGVHYSGHVTAGRADRWVQTAVGDLLPGTRSVALLIDFAGAPVSAVVAVVALVAVFLVLGNRRLAVVAVAGPGLTVVATTALKPAVGRTIHEGYLAYPSGHTAWVTALAVVLALLAADLLEVERLVGVVLVLAAAGAAGAIMAWAQITLDSHYPTDTVGGICAAMAIVPATAYAVDRIADRRALKTL